MANIEEIRKGLASPGVEKSETEKKLQQDPVFRQKHAQLEEILRKSIEYL